MTSPNGGESSTTGGAATANSVSDGGNANGDTTPSLVGSTPATGETSNATGAVATGRTETTGGAATRDVTTRQGAWLWDSTNGIRLFADVLTAVGVDLSDCTLVIKG